MQKIHNTSTTNSSRYGNSNISWNSGGGNNNSNNGTIKNRAGTFYLSSSVGGNRNTSEESSPVESRKQRFKRSRSRDRNLSETSSPHETFSQVISQPVSGNKYINIDQNYGQKQSSQQNYSPEAQIQSIRQLQQYTKRSSKQSRDGSADREKSNNKNSNNRRTRNQRIRSRHSRSLETSRRRSLDTLVDFKPEDFEFNSGHQNNATSQANERIASRNSKSPERDFSIAKSLSFRNLLAEETEKIFQQPHFQSKLSQFQDTDHKLGGVRRQRVHSANDLVDLIDDFNYSNGTLKNRTNDNLTAPDSKHTKINSDYLNTKDASNYLNDKNYTLKSDSAAKGSAVVKNSINKQIIHQSEDTLREIKDNINPSVGSHRLDDRTNTRDEQTRMMDFNKSQDKKQEAHFSNHSSCSSSQNQHQKHIDLSSPNIASIRKEIYHYQQTVLASPTRVTNHSPKPLPKRRKNSLLQKQREQRNNGKSVVPYSNQPALPLTPKEVIDRDLEEKLELERCKKNVGMQCTELSSLQERIDNVEKQLFYLAQTSFAEDSLRDNFREKNNSSQDSTRTESPHLKSSKQRGLSNSPLRKDKKRDSSTLQKEIKRYYEKSKKVTDQILNQKLLESRLQNEINERRKKLTCPKCKIVYRNRKCLCMLNNELEQSKSQSELIDKESKNVETQIAQVEQDIIKHKMRIQRLEYEIDCHERKSLEEQNSQSYAGRPPRVPLGSQPSVDNSSSTPHLNPQFSPYKNTPRDRVRSADSSMYKSRLRTFPNRGLNEQAELRSSEPLQQQDRVLRRRAETDSDTGLGSMSTEEDSNPNGTHLVIAKTAQIVI